MIVRQAMEVPDKVAVNWLNEELKECDVFSFKEMLSTASAIAKMLTTEMGLKHGDRVLLVFMPDVARPFVCSFMGCWLAGVICVPVYPPRPNTMAEDMARLSKIVEITNLKVALTTTKLNRLLWLARMKLAMTNFSYSWPQLTWACVETLQPFWDPILIESMVEKIQPQDLAFLQFTSGSTSFPKGVMVSHANLKANIDIQMKSLENRYVDLRDMVMVGWLPWYHDFGLIAGMLMGCAIGSTIVAFSPLAFLAKPLSWLIAITKYRGTATGVPNFALARCSRDWKRLSEDKRPNLDLSSLQEIIIGAEPIQSHVLTEFAEVFRSVGLDPKCLTPSYGLAEHVLVVSNMYDLDLDRIADGHNVVNCGYPGYGVDVKIVDHKTLVECLPETVGEIWVSSKSTAEGYWGLPDVTKEVFKAQLNGKTYLRTGDLGYMKDGAIFVNGRLKDVIIVGGHNIYPQDVEQSIVEGNDEVRPGRLVVVSLADELDAADDHVGVVAEIRDANTDIESCRKLHARIAMIVRKHHGLTATKIALIKPRTLPRTTSGKVQRQGSKKGLLNGTLQVVNGGLFSLDDVEAILKSDVVAKITQQQNAVVSEDTRESCSSALENRILEVFCRVGGISKDAVNDGNSLMELGMGSMQLLRVAHELESLCPTVTVLSLLQPISLKELIHKLANPQEASVSGSLDMAIEPIDSSAVDTAGLPVSLGQEQMLIIDSLIPGSCAYNVPVAWRIHGPLNTEILKKAVLLLVERHIVLSMRFENRSGKWLQFRDEALKLQAEGMEVQKGNDNTDVFKYLEREVARPFDLENGPAFRVSILSVNRDDHVFMIMGHHVVTDGWSMGILMQEFCQAYNALIKAQSPYFPAQSIQYHDFAAWQHQWLDGGTLEGHLEFWKNKLEGAPALLEIPTDRPRGQSMMTAVAGHVGIEIDAGVFQKVQQLASECQGTAFMVLLAALNILLSRYTQQMDIVIGAMVAGRWHPQLMNVVGYIANLVPIRVTQSKELSFRELVSAVKIATLEAFEHSMAPVHKIIEAVGASRDASHHPVFQVIFNLQNLDLVAHEAEMSHCKVEAIPEFCRPPQSRFDLALELGERQGAISGTFEFTTDLFDEATVSRMASHFTRLVESLVSKPDDPVGQMSMLTGPEHHRLIHELPFDGTHRYDVQHECLHELFHQHAEAAPKSTCLIFRGQSMTYEEVDVESNRLAHHLMDLGVRPDTNVGIMADKSFEMIIGILGALKSGAAYTPIDPQHPSQRIAAIAEDACIHVMLVHTSHDVESGLEALHLHIVHIRSVSEQLSLYPSYQSYSKNLAYTIFTSGSTGRPKGVMVPHRAVVNFLQWMTKEFSLTKNDRYLQNIHFTFDLSMMEIWLALTSGAALILPDPEHHPEPSYVVDLISNTGATFCCSVPSLLRGFADICPHQGCPSLRVQISCGEVLPVAVAAKFLEKLPGCTLANTYGPTEATIHVTSQIVNGCDFDGPLSIGRPLSHVAIYIVDENLQPVPIGVPGELMISGV